MFVPGYGRTYDEGNTDRFPVDVDGFIDLCTFFPYLGSKISADCTDDADIDRSTTASAKKSRERDEEAAVRVVRVIHPTLRHRALAAQRGVAREVGVFHQGNRARHGPNDKVHHVEESHQHVRAREAVRFARDQELHRRERTTLTGPRCTDAPQQASSVTLNGLGVQVQGRQERARAQYAAHIRRLDEPAP